LHHHLVVLSIAAIGRTPCGRGGFAAVAASFVPGEIAVVGRGGGGRVDGRRFLDRRRCLLQAGGHNGDDGNGDLEGWESARAWLGGGESGASSYQAEPTHSF
jgi:hypothetical protein